MQQNEIFVLTFDFVQTQFFFQRYNCVHMWLCGSNMRSDIWTIWTNFGFVNICLFAIQDPTISKTILICCLDRNRSILNSCSWMWQKKNGQYWKSRDHQIRHQKILKSSSFFKSTKLHKELYDTSTTKYANSYKIWFCPQ